MPDAHEEVVMLLLNSGLLGTTLVIATKTHRAPLVRSIHVLLLVHKRDFSVQETRKVLKA